MTNSPGSVFKRCGCGDAGGARSAAGCPRLAQRGHGSWYACLELPAGLDGRRRRLRRGGFSTRQAARAALAGWLLPPRPTLTTGQWLTAWLDSRAVLRASTVRAYESHVRLYLLPHLGGIPLAELSAADVAAMFAAIARRPVLPARPLSPGSVTRLRATLRTALSAAGRAGLVERNAAHDVELPPGRRPHPLVWTASRTRAWRDDRVRPPVAVWTPAQTAAFLAAVEGDPLGLLFRLVALRGLRRGEVCGLYWTDLDLDDRSLTWSGTWSRSAARRRSPNPRALPAGGASRWTATPAAGFPDTSTRPVA